MNKLKSYILTLVMAVAVTAFAVPPLTAAAYNPLDGACASNPDSEVCKNKDEKVEPVFKIVTNTLLYIVGAISVIMIVVAGVMYTISSGDSAKVTRAKNMLTYAIVGLVVAFIAFAIVNWVMTLFK